MARRAPALLLVLVCAACGGATEAGPAGPSGDGPNDPAIAQGKADGSLTDCQLSQIVDLVNDAATSYARLKELGLSSRAANNIVRHRDGADGTPGTPDDDRFDDALELDDIPWVGPRSFDRLAANVDGDCAAPGDAEIEVIFSPQPYATSHLTRVVAELDAAQRSIDVAMYSLSDSSAADALIRAAQRGVSVRAILEAASEHRRAPQGTLSARFEDAGIEVRWVNRVMHHKFAIVDGPRASPDDASSARLVSGSGNWSSSAATKYDENTVFVRGNPELSLVFQREFNHLWHNSRAVVWNESIEFFESLGIEDSMIVDDPAVEAVFTSTNFRITQVTAGPSFTVIPGSEVGTERLVQLIESATSSIHVASGHLRNRRIAQALIAKHEANPSMDVRVYLDGQEYISATSQRSQEEERQACVDRAGADERAQAACLVSDYLYSYEVHRAGIPLKYKYYAYRWNVAYAAQMHHKYILVDGRWVASGSFNFSDNAEHNTMENVVLYDGEAFPALAAAFEQNFETIWVTGEAEGRQDRLLTQVQGGSFPIPIVFDPMALDWDEVTALKRAIRTACPPVDSTEYRSNATGHRTCSP